MPRQLLGYHPLFDMYLEVKCPACMVRYVLLLVILHGSALLCILGF